MEAKPQFRSNGSSGSRALLASAGSLTTSLRFSLSHHVTSMMVRLVLVSPLATNGLHMLPKHVLDRCVWDLLIQSQAPLTYHGLAG